MKNFAWNPMFQRVLCLDVLFSGERVQTRKCLDRMSRIVPPPPPSSPASTSFRIEVDMFTGLLPVFDQGCERESAMMLPGFAAMLYHGEAAIASQQPAICSFP